MMGSWSEEQGGGRGPGGSVQGVQGAAGCGRCLFASPLGLHTPPHATAPPFRQRATPQRPRAGGAARGRLPHAAGGRGAPHRATPRPQRRQRPSPPLTLCIQWRRKPAMASGGGGASAGGVGVRQAATPFGGGEGTVCTPPFASSVFSTPLPCLPPPGPHTRAPAAVPPPPRAHTHPTHPPWPPKTTNRKRRRTRRNRRRAKRWVPGGRGARGKPAPHTNAEGHRSGRALRRGREAGPGFGACAQSPLATRRADWRPRVCVSIVPPAFPTPHTPFHPGRRGQNVWPEEQEKERQSAEVRGRTDPS